MRTSLFRRLLRRHKQIKKQSDWWLKFQCRRGCHPGFQETTWEWIACDKYLHQAIRSNVVTGRETANITRIINQGETVLMWDDEKRTWTMPTARVKI